ncbi:ribosomal protein L30, ferredoxin-like fold domain-containing protein [Phascolomyces articulosus]|uniref:Ribosomal protein L30, ferredoxin-like fold domain-containing protein n=1 Tax=Phascolomyces articulosus TaxID=60185 RepID=A0AAD5K8J6_9FUNG|nr:ribosomal protein L30, ferredoxin-like fold domain-containing protein [Phascolomyces articulosus]
MNFVPETLLKKRKVNERLAAENARKRAEERKARQRASRRQVFKRADEFVKEFKTKEYEQGRIRRMAMQHKRNTGKNKNPLLEGDEDKSNIVVLVIRTRNSHNIHPKVKKTLKKMRLHQENDAVFLRLDGMTRKNLKVVLPYVKFGSANLNTVRELLVKRGHAMISGHRKPISDNTMIEEQLGEQGIICVDDIIHELVTCGENFDKVNQFLCPFKLNKQMGRWREKRLKEYSAKEDGEEVSEIDVNQLVETLN